MLHGAASMASKPCSSALVASRTIDHRAGAQANAVLGEAGHGVQLPHQHSRAQKGWAEARHGWSRAEPRRQKATRPRKAFSPAFLSREPSNALSGQARADAASAALAGDAAWPRGCSVPGQASPHGYRRDPDREPAPRMARLLPEAPEGPFRSAHLMAQGSPASRAPRLP